MFAGDTKPARETIKKLHQDVLARLVSRNPLLRYISSVGGKKKSGRIDLFDLFSENQGKLALVGQEKTGAVASADDLLAALLIDDGPGGAKIEHVSPAQLGHIQAIARASEEANRQTGQATAYIGYPFVFTPVKKGGESRNGRADYYFSPLFLWPVSISEIKPTKGAFKLRRTADSAGDDADFVSGSINKVLVTVLRKEFGLKMPWDDGDAAPDLAGILKVIKKLFVDWKGFSTGIFGIPDSARYSLPEASACVPVPTGEELQRMVTESDPCVVPCAMLCTVSFKKQALVDDVAKILEEAETSKLDRDDTVLSRFVSPVKEDRATEYECTNIEGAWSGVSVIGMDHTQRAILGRGLGDKVGVTVLQGPPGTGKSQTIVNAISKALANNQSVLVVCQKRAALDVIKKRLDGVGLNVLCAQVNNPESDRAALIKEIRDCEPCQHHPHGAKLQLAELERGISGLEEDIERHWSAYSDKDVSGHSFLDLKAIAENGRKNLNAQAWAGLCENFAWEEDLTPNDLNRLKADILEFSKLLKDSEYGPDNPWAKAQLRFIPENGHQWSDVIEALNVFHSRCKDAHSNGEISELLKQHSWSLYDLSPKDWGAFVPANSHSLLMPLFEAIESLRFYRLDQVFPDFRKATYDSVAGNLNWITSAIRYGIGIVPLYEVQKTANVCHWARAILCFGEAEYDRLVEMVLGSWARAKLAKLPQPPSALRTRRSIADLREKTNEHQAASIEFVISRFADRKAKAQALDDARLLRLRRARTGEEKTQIREIYQKGWTEASGIKPILLADPDTVSAILPLKPGMFDLLIVDEASQMFMADALPSLYRAKSVLVCGDEMQMPPSNFFRSDSDDIEEEESDALGIRELSSIPALDGISLLDAAIAYVPSAIREDSFLGVHYRSEHKELIDFSNHAFYGGRLMSPSGNGKLPFFMSRPIEFRQVQGDYVAKKNLKEAKEVVTILKEVWSHSECPTVGVIVMNGTQKETLDEMLEDEAASDPAFAACYERERNRSMHGEDVGFFVRAVEDVQGDERDVIILATTYSGSSRNFGPIGYKEKGRKRLNVAITRAKKGMMIISSLTIDHIASDAQSDKESWFFCMYLKYARAISNRDVESASRILQMVSEAIGNTKRAMKKERGAESPFEEQVAEFLRSAGYHVEFQIGEAGFRIDLGVKKNAADTAYLCGIECDGRAYHNGWRARLNDVWRQDILESKGWKIHRIWGEDWFQDKERTKKLLVESIEKLGAN